ncbi:hypothetical protein ACET3Z_013955 [Daucus carota]
MVRDQPKSFPLAFLGSRENSSCIQLPLQFHTGTQSRFTRFRFIGYCNGLVCIADYYSPMLYVWNPSIKRFKMLPTPNLITKTTRVKLGFGYDSVCDDYKVVRILVSSVSNVVEAELYSANEDRWRDIEVPVGLNNAWPLWCCIPAQAINEVLYFVASQVLVSFDLHNELFEVYRYPYSVKDIQNFTSFVYEGAVAMIFKTAVGDGLVHSLWTLDDAGGKVCWTKKFVFEPELEIDRVELYLGSGRFVAVDFCDFQYFVYDLEKKETERLLLSLVEHNVSSVVKYTESLVSLAGFEQVEKVVLSEETMHTVLFPSQLNKSLDSVGVIK